MLHQFLAANRMELINRCRARVAERIAPKPLNEDWGSGVPVFLDQLIGTLQAKEPDDSAGAGAARPADDNGASFNMSRSAQCHGRDLMRRGFTVEQVVHDYGDLCQVITGLALETGTQIEVEEFRVLNSCLDDGIADAVTEFSYQHDSSMAEGSAQTLNERLGFLAHELRNHLNTASMAALALKSGHVGLAGATSAVLDRGLIGMRTVIDRTLADVRSTAGITARNELFSVADFILEVTVSAALEAKVRECTLSAGAVDPTLAIEADRDLLFSAVANLLQNAFKFTRHHTDVKLQAQAVADRILISVEDRCGGLPAGAAETIFQPFTQVGADKTGLGLGLAICRRSVEANGGQLSVRDLPGTGCVFIIDLPRRALPG